MRFTLATAVAITVALQAPLLADEVVLTLRADADGQSAKALTMTDLETIPQITFTTSTVWTEGLVEFSGPSLRSVLAMTNRRGVVAQL